jgi:hypothetical protein
MRLGRHKGEAIDPLEMTEFTEALSDLEQQMRDIVARLEASAKSASQVVARARRARSAAQRGKEKGDERD